MASKVATYAFTDKSCYEAAKDYIKENYGNDSWDPGTTSDYWLLHITSDCANPGDAGRTCLSYNGKPY
ncbi:hypothetical protein AGMMS49965_22170 [Bacteroidia bacterium]|nr:hypothetical protein AGMMS49965_22170 [Bacteroidia bacterium]